MQNYYELRGQRLQIQALENDVLPTTLEQQ
jgi:hypothetical protein